MVILGCQPVLVSPGPAALGWAAPSAIGGLTGTMALDRAQDGVGVPTPHTVTPGSGHCTSGDLSCFPLASSPKKPLLWGRVGGTAGKGGVPPISTVLRLQRARPPRDLDFLNCAKCFQTRAAAWSPCPAAAQLLMSGEAAAATSQLRGSGAQEQPKNQLSFAQTLP